MVQAMTGRHFPYIFQLLKRFFRSGYNHGWIPVLAVCTALALSACAGAPRLDEVKSVRMCAAGKCGWGGQDYTADEMLNGIFQLFKRTEDNSYNLCDADPESKKCKDDDISMFVQGGPIPGIGSLNRAEVLDVQMNPKQYTITSLVSNHQKFIGIPMATTDHNSTINVYSPQKIVLVEDDHYANWMAVGNVVMSFNMAIDYVNLDQGQLGGYYSWGSAGTGIGKGSGYVVLQFPAKMAKGENWLDASLALAQEKTAPPQAQPPARELEQPKEQPQQKQANTQESPAPATAPEPVRQEKQPPKELAAAKPSPRQDQPDTAELEQIRAQLERQKEELLKKQAEAELERQKAQLRMAQLQAELDQQKAHVQMEEEARKRVELELQKAKARIEEEARIQAELELKKTEARMQEEARKQAELEHKKAEAHLAGFGTYHALVIGNNRYDHLPQLQTAENDAKAVARILEQNYDFHVKLLLNATRSTVMSELSRLRRKLTPMDNLLIYYAGHGWLDQDANEGYWLPVDATTENEVNWISNASITTLLRAIKAKHALVVADSCYSGKLVRGIKIQRESQDYLAKIAQKRARVVMASGGLEPVADSGGKGQHSVFTSAFLEVLRENDGVIDGTQMFTRIRRPVMLNSDQTPEYADIHKAGHEGGDFIFVRRK
ncbi:MAG: caspase family protein [Desulfobacterales bacterium]|uniref:Caspase family protein n=1 Tax=Candidatus Desulfatibia profunda TaxID=2841695 RepID=A0A8J6NRM6_9BACT|nr:caspase family protein [Candidatus Desulfatibia profunda]MBL7178731.1 caspase family protein [Desulfobacterales bacterium]